MTRFRPVSLVLLLAVLAPAAAAQSVLLSPQSVFDRAAPAVAVIRVADGRSSGVGTGFTIGPDGVVVTAAHVVLRAERIAVDFDEGGPQEARVVGYDARRDLALLSVAPRPTPSTVEIVQTASVRPGDAVVVIGTPRGRPRVMTTGTVRDLGLTLPGLVPGIFIMVDAEVAPGNSGGPVLNDRGQVIGVISARTTRSGVSAGLAVSGSTVLASLPALAEGARLDRAWIGIAGVTLQPRLAGQRGLPADRGVLILEVLPDSPAARAGLRGENSDGPPGDVIVAIDGEPVEDWEDLLTVLGAREPGQRIGLGIARGSSLLEVRLVLEARAP